MKGNLSHKQLFSIVGFILLISFSINLRCQEVNLPLKPKQKVYSFKEIRFRGDAPVRDVIGLVEDNRGFIWLASKHGLYRYDGHDFKIFHNKPGDAQTISDSELWSIFILGDTTLCIGATNGISMIDIRTENITNIYNDTEGNPVGYVSDFYIDTDGTIWLAGLMGLYSLTSDLSFIKNHHLETPPIRKGNPAFEKRVYTITEHYKDKDILMLATEYGLISFDKKKNKIHKLYPNKKSTHPRSQPPVYDFAKDGKYLWTKSWISGFPRFDMETENWENFLYPKGNSDIWSLHDFTIKNDREIWMCDWDYGVYIFDKETKQRFPQHGTTVPDVLKGKYMNIFMQKDGTIWLSNANGLWMQNRKKDKFFTFDIPCEYTWVMPIFHDKDNHEYYFGLVHKSYCIARWNYTSNKWSFIKTETDKDKELNTYTFFKDRNDTIWVGTGGRGLWQLDRKSNIIKPYKLPGNNSLDIKNRTIYKLFEDSRNNLWIGTGRDGVLRLNPNHTKVDHFINNPDDTTSLIKGTHYRAIEEDKFGRIWIGNYYGFCVFDPETGKFSQDIPKQLQKNGIFPGWTYSIVKDTNDNIWMTIVGHGILKFSEKEKEKFSYKIFQTDEGLKDLNVRFMTKDHKGNLWIINNGLLYINPYDESFIHTDDKNGLLWNMDGDDIIYTDIYGNVFCGDQVGKNWQNEVEVLSVSKISNLIIENIFVNGEPIKWCYAKKRNLKLSGSKNQNNITFNYTAICFEEYDQVRYRYKLEGLETNWNPPTKTLEARYTNLKPGKYKFVLDVAYKGNWLGYNQTIEFQVLQVFWKTWWFISTILIILGAIIYSLYINRKQQIEKQKQIRIKIASDLHDDVGSTLSSISIMSDILQSQLSDSFSDEMIKEIGSNAHIMLESMDDIIWSVNPSNDEIQNLVLRLKEFAIPLFETKDITFEINTPKEILDLNMKMEVRRNIFLIAKEAINNLVKYSKCKNAKIEFSYKNSILTMIIEDDGIGFDVKDEENNNRNGLKNITKRAEQIKGNLSILSEIGKGTNIMLEIKII